jgi:hypothetical protein
VSESETVILVWLKWNQLAHLIDAGAVLPIHELSGSI